MNERRRLSTNIEPEKIDIPHIMLLYIDGSKYITIFSQNSTYQKQIDTYTIISGYIISTTFRYRSELPFLGSSGFILARASFSDDIIPLTVNQSNSIKQILYSELSRSRLNRCSNPIRSSIMADAIVT